MTRVVEGEPQKQDPEDSAWLDDAWPDLCGGPPAPGIEPDPASDPPAFPADLLPGLWQPWAADAARAAGAPVDYVALSLLGAAASLIGGARRVSPVAGWREPCVLWTALAGAPGAGRRRGATPALGLLRALQDELVPDAHAACCRHAAGQERARWRHRQWCQRVRHSAGYIDPPPLPSDALPPAPPRQLVTDEPSPGAVAGLLHGNPRGLLLAPASLGDWLAGVARQRGGRDRAQWLKAWSAEPWAVTRYRDVALDSQDAAVSILGRLPAEGFDAARLDGALLCRLLFAAPPRPPVQALQPASRQLQQQAQAALMRLAGMDAAARDVPLSAGALAAFEDFRRAHGAAAAALDPSASSGCRHAAAWFSRGPANVLRLAGVLAWLAWAAAHPPRRAEPAQLPAGAMRAAIRLWQDYLWPHARFVLGASDRALLQQQVEQVRRWLRANSKTRVSREDLRRRALKQQVDAARTDVIIAVLVKEGILEPLETAPTGGRKEHRWRVHLSSPSPLVLNIAHK
jgi:hypothetical protein